MDTIMTEAAQNQLIDAYTQTLQAGILGITVLILAIGLVGAFVALLYVRQSGKASQSGDQLTKAALDIAASTNEGWRAVKAALERLTERTDAEAQLTSVQTQTLQSVIVGLKEAKDATYATSETVAGLSTKISDFGALLTDVVSRLDGIEKTVKLADCEPHTKRILDAIENAKREIIEFRPEPDPPYPTKKDAPEKITPLDADAAKHGGLDDLPKASGQ